MKAFMLANTVVATMLALLLPAGPAQAQLRTWVASNGADANPCSRTAPCLTLAGAFAKTQAGGEISIVDSHVYAGNLTINKAITINGEGALASVHAPSGTAITVAAGASDQVILRNLFINGAGGGSVGISLVSGNLTVDKCFIYGFTTGFVGGIGINVAASSTSFLAVRNSDITNSSHGIVVTTTSGYAVAGLDEVHINNIPGLGVSASSTNAYIEINRSSIRNAGQAAVSASGNSVVSVNNSEITNSALAINANSGSIIRINANSIFDNTTGFSIGAGATIATANNNKTAGNGGSTIPNGAIGNQ